MAEQLDSQDFNRLALEQLDCVYRAARALAASAADADDLVQETYLNALRAADRFELREFGLRPWLLRILHNVHVNRGVRAARQPRTVEAGMLDAAVEKHNGVSLQRLDPSADAALSCAMSKLAPELRTTLTLWAVEDLTYREIAEVMSVPIGTVMSRLHRARQLLRNYLVPQLEGSSRGRE